MADVGRTDKFLISILPAMMNIPQKEIHKAQIAFGNVTS